MSEISIEAQSAEEALIEEKLTNIFYSDHMQSIERIKKSNKRFVHYTSAEAAMNILINKEVWLRQPYCMNDIKEIEHGLHCLISAYRHQDQYFKNTINSIFPGISDDIENGFDELYYRTREDIYIFCVSEHEETEDRLGRLSMWRAYGRDTGVAIVMNQASFFSESDSLKAYVYRVRYRETENFLNDLVVIADKILENKDFIESLGRENVSDLILNLFRDVVISTKHKGFSEENEWRIVYAPGMESSEHLIHEIKTINSLPQEIYKVSLKNKPECGITRLEPHELIDRIIIGPTQYPLPLYKAFVNQLNKLGVAESKSKIFISDIPIRK